MNSIKFPFQFDVEKIIEELQLFGPDDFYEMAGLYVEIDTVMVCNLLNPPKFNNKDTSIKSVPTQKLKSCPYLMEILDFFQCQKEVFRFQTLKSGKFIRKHNDKERSFKNGYVRIHIPVITNDEVYIFLENERVIMKPGECWYMDIALEHELENRGKTHRIHLIMDCLVNDWWREQFSKNGYEQIENNSQYAMMDLEELQNMKKHLLNQIETSISSEVITDLQKELDARMKN